MKNNKINAAYPRIKDLRDDCDKTQAEIAQILCLHLTQYRRYEKAETPVPADFIAKIAMIYDVSADYVLGLTNDKRKYW